MPTPGEHKTVEARILNCAQDIDWPFRESAGARPKIMVKRILNKHGYPPDLQEAMGSGLNL